MGRCKARNAKTPEPSTLWGFAQTFAAPVTSGRNESGTNMPYLTSTIASNASQLKTRLVDIGLDALSRGDWLVVSAVTTLIRNRGWTHE
jgi:hypothetical protein